MAVSNDNMIEYSNVDGCFVEKEYKKRFEYTSAILSDWDKEHGFNYRVFVGPLCETRPANILKTVAYVCVDEDANGDPVVEKWRIRHEWNR